MGDPRIQQFSRPRPVLLLLLLLLLVLLPTSPGLPAGPPGNNAAICLLPMDDGPCRAYLPSYYYDRYTQTCLPFIYGGCKGNSNNFETLKACQATCGRLAKVPKVCRMDTRSDTCKGKVEKYFFNMSSMACEKFSFGECPVGPNQFSNKASCVKFCSPKSNMPKFCSSPLDRGSCSAHVTRYYFNIKSGTCEEFSYSGCGGNHNNFISQKDCTKTCSQAKRKGLRNHPGTVFVGHRLKPKPRTQP
ncbi:tissue factor pathway inhibitor 2 [Tachyglossus aculeatus]|uniref:tissue factor pathway inhibitor 2 n=1 Tax=Tachyglossus aculeatus TaxID=9261 RepID=UPI0018F7234F|nr:tissue factor pathway inhibitor 2 [Tachyglossus aculeatus]